MSPRTCTRCASIPLELFDEKRYKYKHWKHSPNAQSLRRSAERGCYSCRIFLNTLLKGESYGHSVDLHTTADCVAISDGDQGLSWLINPGTTRERKMFHSESEHGSLQFLGSSVDCDLNVNLMRALIENCLTNHPDCQRSEPYSTPTRLLDLGEDPVTPVVRVVPGSDCQYRQWRYLTLSHCWGVVPEDAHWKLTTEREQRYATNVSFDALPKTFQEAILLTKKLGERYLWIDSLCIIQDSRKDWKKEASRMAEVYSGGICTLSTATDSASSGCFYPRAEGQFSPVELKLSYASVRVPTNERNSATVVLFPSLKWWHHDRDIPVLGRAWTLQERELSIRMIQFTDREFRWKCNTIATTEAQLYKENFSYAYQQLNPVLNLSQASLPKDWDREPNDNKEDVQSFLSSPAFAYYVSQKDRKGARRYWYNLMEEFSNCSITYRSDRLAALQGLVVRHITLFPDGHVLGMWTSTIRCGLLWERSWRSTFPEKRPAPFLFPTWSWLSLEAPIQFPQLLASTVPSRPADLKLRVEAVEASDLWAVQGSGRLRDVGCDCGDDPVDDGAPYVRKIIHFNGTVKYDTREDSKLFSTVVCLPLEVVTKRGDIGDPTGNGLALVPAEYPVPTYRKIGVSHYPSVPTYKRIGVFHYTSRDAFDNVEPVDFRII